MKLGERRQYREKLRKLSPEELGDELVKLRKEQFSLRMQRATGQQPKPRQFGDARRNIARVQPGKVLFEMEGVDETTAREAFRLAGSKLSVSTTFVKRQVR